MIKGDKNNIGDLTIAEFNKLTQIVEDNDPVALFSFFGYDVDKLSLKEMNELSPKLASLSWDTVQIKNSYTLDGIKLGLVFDLTKISAGQFIDFQGYMADGKKLEDILSVFLIPMKKKFGVKWVAGKYNTGYDMQKVKSAILNNLSIKDANALSNFFLNLSTRSLSLLQGYLMAKEKMMKTMKKKDSLNDQ